MQYRHEWKHIISYGQQLILRQRLSAVAQADSHAVNGTYHIRSLYFDNLQDKALREKLDGVNMREKFRLRYYNEDTSHIHLEKKSKLNGLCAKAMAELTAEQAQAIIEGDICWMMASDIPLVQELYSKMLSQGMRPKTIVDYDREPFVFAPGNVRVTMDYNIRSGAEPGAFFDPASVTLPAGDGAIILEVKWDDFLPDIIRDAVQLTGCHTEAFSKYAACRIYG